MMIRYTMKAANVRFLGPGNRAALWVHGCPRACEGCIASDMNRTSGYLEDSPEALADWFLSTGADGLTLSGGEPFAQAESLASLVRLIRSRKPEINVIIYTGYILDELTDPRHSGLLSEADLLIDGPYLRDQDSGRFAIGSDNQRMFLLSERISEETVNEYFQAGKTRQVELRQHSDGIQLIGVPDSRQMNVWKRLKEAYHHD